VKISEQTIASLAGEDIRQISSTYCQMVKEEVGRNLPKTKLPGCYDWLVELITWLDDSVGGAHADWKEARANHDRVQMPSAIIIGKVSQSEGNWVLKDFRIGVRKEDRVVQTSIEYPKPA
jgi:hypothetical protein